MKTSKAGIDFIKKEEGVVLKVYKDQVGILTVGVGHVTKLPLGTKITMAEADALLAADLLRFETAINKLVKVKLTQHEFDALVSFTFNCGEGALGKSSLLRDINAGKKEDKERMTTCFAMWRNAGGKPILLKRRLREAAVFCQ